MIQTNKVNTDVTDELLKSLDKEVKAELIDAIESIQFIKNLISTNRKYAKDLEKDEEGKIIVNVTNPHILEDMDYFRQPAITFQQHGKYTLLRPNTHPLSEYVKFWKEEMRRCLEGYIRESDGEWIPGDFYFYLNYSPILKTKVTEGSKRSQRVMDFPDIYDGDYLYFHYKWQARELGKHGVVLKKRGAGFSFKGGSGLAKNFILGDTIEARKNIRAFAIANEREYLTKDGVLNKFIDIIDFCSDHTPFPRLRLKDSLNDMAWTMGYEDKESNVLRGTKNQVMGVTLKNDPQKARGKRGAFIIWEEMGKFPNILTAWQVARPSVEEDEYAFGTMIAYGTGGTEDADFSGAEELFYSPRGYNILELPNVYDKNTNEHQKSGFFFPQYLNSKGKYDKDGNSDVIKTLVMIFKNRMEVKYYTSDPNALVQEKAERPITPQEAIMRKEGNLFPIMDLKEYLSEIKPRLQDFIAPHSVGNLVYAKDGGIKFEISPDVYPIRDYPIKDQKHKEGGIEIFAHPQKGPDGVIPHLRYIAGIDPFDDDMSFTNSLGSILVYDTFTEQIVAEYTGRPVFAEDFYEICLRLLKYYNATANYESNKKGLYSHFKNKNALHYLCDTPQVLRDMNLAKTKGLYGNKSKGTTATNAVNTWGRRLQADWMRKICPTDEEKLNLHTIRSIAYIEEAISWNPDGNFDRISAMGMLMIYREDVLKRIERVKENKETVFTKDKFFERNYQRTSIKKIYEQYAISNQGNYVGFKPNIQD